MTLDELAAEVLKRAKEIEPISTFPYWLITGSRGIPLGLKNECANCGKEPYMWVVIDTCGGLCSWECYGEFTRFEK